MSHPLVLNTLLFSAPQADLPYTLQAQYTPEETAAEVVVTDRIAGRIDTADQLYRTGARTAGVGLVIFGSGAVLTIAGIFPAALGAPQLLVAGALVLGAGSLTLAVALPMMATGALMGQQALRDAGLDITGLPGWTGVAGIGVTLVGLAVGSPAVLGTGALMFVGGTTTQVILSRRALRTHLESASLAIHPVTALDGYGVGVTLRR